MSYGSRSQSAPVSPATSDSTVPSPKNYGDAIRGAIKPHIVLREFIAGNPTAEVTLTLPADGRIASQELTKPSGNAVWDAAVMRAICSVQRLPADENGKRPPRIVISFRYQP